MIVDMRSVKLVLSLVLLAASIACGNSPTAPPPPLNVPFSTFDITVGTGTEATTGKTVRVYYTGWVYSTTATDNKGAQFQTVTTGTGITFPPLGSGQALKGWEQGVTGMKVGGKRRIIIPPDLGYGLNPPSGSGIPQNATLIFEVELLSVAG
jgi:FKBP-type peptidyl-prolyl cis-trans isomerase FkpA